MSQARLLVRRSAFALDVDVAWPDQGITVLFGASGSGKTTFLRCVAGLERASGSLVEIAGHTWQNESAHTWLPTHERPLGYVFQEASLFEHLNVRENLSFGMKRAGAPPQGLEQAVALLGIGHLLDRSVNGLSGGERQRVAIARALATAPKLLLLDEPLASLDAARKAEVLPWLERLRDESKVPMLYVTHSIDEAARLGNHVIQLEAGRVKAFGSLAEMLPQLHGPTLLPDGPSTVVDAAVAAIDEAWSLAQLRTANGNTLWVKNAAYAIGQPLRLRLLARDVSVSLDAMPRSSMQNQLAATVVALQPAADASQCVVSLNANGLALQALITARAAHQLGLQPGMAVWAAVKAVAVL